MIPCIQAQRPQCVWQRYCWALVNAVMSRLRNSDDPIRTGVWNRLSPEREVSMRGRIVMSFAGPKDTVGAPKRSTVGAPKRSIPKTERRALNELTSPTNFIPNGALEVG